MKASSLKIAVDLSETLLRNGIRRDVRILADTERESAVAANQEARFHAEKVRLAEEARWARGGAAAPVGVIFEPTYRKRVESIAGTVEFTTLYCFDDPRAAAFLGFDPTESS